MTDEPLLGLATTRQLLEELEARYLTAGDERRAMAARQFRLATPDAVLDYRTVDADKPAADVDLKVPGRSLQPGDRLAGGQIADGIGQVIERVLIPDDLPAEAPWVVILTDGRPFTIDPDRTFRIRRTAPHRL